VQLATGRAPEHGDEQLLVEAGDLADGRDPVGVQLRRGRGADAPKALSCPAGTTSSPSGLATPLATLARNFVLATPTVIGTPTRSRTSRRRRSAISGGVPLMCARPRASRNASSIESPSTSGDASSKIEKSSLLASA
jgi:hypothetical protein